MRERNSRWFRRSGTESGALISLHLGVCERPLFAPEEQAENTPKAGQRHCDPGNTGQTQTEPAQKGIGPRTNLISDAVNKGVDETLGFVFVFPTENGEQYFARGTCNGKISSATRDLKNGEQAQHRRDPNCD